MPAATTSYDLIQEKIQSLKSTYPSLRQRADEYVFSALCIKSNLYKNPAFSLNENDYADGRDL